MSWADMAFGFLQEKTELGQVFLMGFISVGMFPTSVKKMTQMCIN